MKGLALLFFCVCLASPAFSEELISQPSLPNALLKVAVALVFIVVMIFAIGWFVKRSGFSGLVVSKHMRVLSAMPLSHREKVVLIQVGQQQFLLGVAPGRVSPLHTFPENESALGGVLDDEPESNDFASQLKKMLSPRSSQ